jgi:RNA polymerase sigma-70 factor (ECF subfamily)
MASPSDRALVEQAQNDPQAFVGLYDRYFRRIYSFVYLQTHDEALTKDVTASTFEKALVNIGRFQWRGVTFSAWLYRIARNELAQQRRRQRLRNLFRADFAGQQQRFQERAAEAAVQVSEQHDRLHIALSRLSAADRELISLRFFDELSSAETAEILGVSTSNVYVRLHRALKRLGNELETMEAVGGIKTDVAF